MRALLVKWCLTSLLRDMLPIIVSKVVDCIFFLFLRESLGKAEAGGGKEVLMEDKLYPVHFNSSYPLLSSAWSRHIPCLSPGSEAPKF